MIYAFSSHALLEIQEQQGKLMKVEINFYFEDSLKPLQAVCECQDTNQYLLTVFLIVDENKTNQTPQDETPSEYQELNSLIAKKLHHKIDKAIENSLKNILRGEIE